MPPHLRSLRRSCGRASLWRGELRCRRGKLCHWRGILRRCGGHAVGVDLGDGIARHPTALYETLFLVALAFVLRAAFERLAEGRTFVLFVSSYLLFRLLVDAIKPGDPLAFGLTAIQWACVGGLAYYGVRFAPRPWHRRAAVGGRSLEPDR